MENTKPLRSRLEEISRRGICVHRDQLRRTVCSQFPDHRLWIREYIANAYDAGARACHISGAEEGPVWTIRIEDDGQGMGREQVDGFLVKFRSMKDRPEQAVGRFGIGSFSVAAIPGQCAFGMTTSTGKETWRFRAGCLLDDTPIRVEGLAPTPVPGTRFDISFRAGSGRLADELTALKAVARRYLYHLPIHVYVHPDGLDFRRTATGPAWTPGPWAVQPGEIEPKRFCFALGESLYDVVLALGEAREAFYQKHVLIMDRTPEDAFLSKALGCRYRGLPHLVVRIDSDAFTVPLGRHCLSDTGSLAPLMLYLRDRVLTEYVETIAHAHASAAETGHDAPIRMYEAFLCGYLAATPERNGPAQQTPLFRKHDGGRITFRGLKDAIAQGRPIYIEAPHGGLDYRVFDGPVLKQRQPGHALEFIQQYFRDTVINLRFGDLVLIEPGSGEDYLTPSERRFGQHLGLHPGAVSRMRTRQGGGDGPAGRADPALTAALHRFHLEISSAARQAAHALESLRWQARRLVGRDAVTPCRSVFYIRRGTMVTLNLNHPEIGKLVRLGESAPQLAAHLAMARCLMDTGRPGLLPHLPPEDREHLINLDALLRCAPAPTDPRGSAPLENSEEPRTEGIRDFNLNNLDDLPF